MTAPGSSHHPPSGPDDGRTGGPASYDLPSAADAERAGQLALSLFPPTPLLSTRLADLTTPGVAVELSPDEADAFGAFAETALSEADAWEANADLPLAHGADDEAPDDGEVIP